MAVFNSPAFGLLGACLKKFQFLSASSKMLIEMMHEHAAICDGRNFKKFASFNWNLQIWYAMSLTVGLRS